MTEDQKDHVLADCLEAYHRQKARGERPNMGAFHERLGEAFEEFQELLLAETAIDHVLDGPSVEALPKAWGPYTLLSELGRGAAGVVYEALHRKLGRKVALKVLRTGIDTDDTARERFNREAQALAQVHHDHIVDLFEFGDVDGRPYYAMELVDGPTLAELVKRGDVPEPRALCEAMAGIADALQSLHEAGIIHRDVKPSNIMRAPNGRFLLADFGLARTAAATTVTRTGDALGTPLYMSPEQMLGKRDEVAARTDVYGFGATLYQALSGQPPFKTDNLHALMRMVLTQRPESPRTVKPDLPHDCSMIAMKCLEKEPGDRYVSAGALATDLRAFAAGERVTGKPLTNMQRGRRWLARRPALAAAALVLVALGTWFLLQPPGPAVLTLIHTPSTAEARVRVDGGEWEPMPMPKSRLEADTPHEIEVLAPGGGFGVWRKTIRGEPDEQLAHAAELPILDWGHPNVVEAFSALGEVARVGGLSAPDRWRSADRKGPALEFIFPRGSVRAQDVAQLQIYVSMDFMGAGALEFRQGETELAQLDFPEPEKWGMVRLDTPPAVVEAVLEGEPVTWCFRWAGSGKTVDAPTFQLSALDLEPKLAKIENAVSQISDEKNRRILRSTLRTKLYLQHDLAQAAFREVEARVAANEDTLYMLLLQKRAVEFLVPKPRERGDSWLWESFDDRWHLKPADQRDQFDEALRSSDARAQDEGSEPK